GHPITRAKRNNYGNARSRQDFSRFPHGRSISPMTWRAAAGSPGPEWPGFHRQTPCRDRPSAEQAAGQIADGRASPVYIADVISGEVCERQPGCAWLPWDATAGAMRGDKPQDGGGADDRNGVAA